MATRKTAETNNDPIYEEIKRPPAGLGFPKIARGRNRSVTNEFDERVTAYLKAQTEAEVPDDFYAVVDLRGKTTKEVAAYQARLRNAVERNERKLAWRAIPESMQSDYNGNFAYQMLIPEPEAPATDTETIAEAE